MKLKLKSRARKRLQRRLEVGAKAQAAIDVDTGVAAAVMRNRFDPTDLTTAAAADDLIADLAQALERA